MGSGGSVVEPDESKEEIAGPPCTPLSRTGTGDDVTGGHLLDVRREPAFARSSSGMLLARIGFPSPAALPPRASAVAVLPASH